MKTFFNPWKRYLIFAVITTVPVWCLLGLRSLTISTAVEQMILESSSTFALVEFIFVALLAHGVVGIVFAFWARWMFLKSPPMAVHIAVFFIVLTMVCLRSVAYESGLFTTFLGQQSALLIFLSKIPLLALDIPIIFMLFWALIQLGRSLAFGWYGPAFSVLFPILIFYGFKELDQRPANTNKGPNVFILAADSLRPDHMSFNGYPLPTTPNLDKLAKEISYWPDTIVPLARTAPSWISIMSGQYPHTHGIRHMFPYQKLRKGVLLEDWLPSVLSKSGYITAVVSDYAGEFFDMFPDLFDYQQVPNALQRDIVIRRNLLLHMPLLLSLYNHGLGHKLFPTLRFLPVNANPKRLSQSVRNTLRNISKHEKFFLTAFYSVTHFPFSTTRPFNSMFVQKDYRGKNQFVFNVRNIQQLKELDYRLPPEDIEQVRALYDQALRAFDKEVGALVAYLKKSGLWDNTIFIVTSDHGENLYEPGTTLLHGKWFRGGDVSYRVPLFLKPQKGANCRSPLGVTSTVDLAPTLAGLLNIKLTGIVDGQNICSASINRSRVVFAESGFWFTSNADWKKEHLLTYPAFQNTLQIEPETGIISLNPVYEDIVIRSKWRAAFTSHYRLIYRPTEPGNLPQWDLVDRRIPIKQQKNLVKENNKTFFYLKSALLSWLEQDPVRLIDENYHLRTIHP